MSSFFEADHQQFLQINCCMYNNKTTYFSIKTEQLAKLKSTQTGLTVCAKNPKVNSNKRKRPSTQRDCR